MIMAMRDATGHWRPGRAGRYHVKVDEHGSLMQWYDDKKIITPGYGYAACDWRMSLVETTEVAPGDIPAILLCRRPGCLARIANYVNQGGRFRFP